MNIATPTVTVIIPCYNYGRYLNKAVQSVLEQTYHDFEIIIVDDCSTDNTREIGEAFQANYSKVTYIRQPQNVGQSDNRNTGIKIAQGEFIALLDADDWWDERYLEESIPHFNNPTVGAVYFYKNIHHNDGSEEMQGIMHSNPIYANLLTGNYIGTAVIFRTSAIPNGYATDLSPALNNMGVDWWILSELSVNHDVVGIPKPYYNYAHHPGQQMSNNLERRIKADRIILDRFKKTYGSLITKGMWIDAMFSQNMREAVYNRSIGEKVNAVIATIKAILCKPFIAIPYKSLFVTLRRY